MTRRLDYNQVAPNGVKALGGVYGYVMQSGLPAELVELVYLRVSQINNCAYCRSLAGCHCLDELFEVGAAILYVGHMVRTALRRPRESKVRRDGCRRLITLRC